jgi:hypothetical protein
VSVVLLRLRAELRNRWPSWLGLALIAGLAGAVVIAAAAGARRTDSAYTRFLAASRASDVAIYDDTEGTPHVPDPAKIARLPQVAEVVPIQFIGYLLGNVGMVVPRDGRPGVEIDRFKLLSGRLPDPRRSDEVVVAFAVAEQRHLDVGSTIRTVSRADEAEAKRRGMKLPPIVTLRVVGIEASPGEFPPQPPGLAPLIHGTLAFYRDYERLAHTRFGRRFAHPEWPSLLIRLKHGHEDLPAFLSGAERLAHGKPLIAQPQQQMSAPVRHSFHLQALALWLLAALVGLTAALVFSQLVARQTFVESTEGPTLRALGMTRNELLGLGMARAAAVAVPAALLAAVAGFLISPLTPIGEARIAEPSPGLRPDALVLPIGGVATLLAVLGLAALPVWRAARLAGSPLGTAEPEGRARSSALANALSRAGLPPTAVAGTRLALEPGRGRTALPVRATLAGLVLAVTALTASLVFGASLNHLIATPRLYGWNWDLQVTNYGQGPDLTSRAAAIAAIPGIAEISIAGGGPVTIGKGRVVDTMATDGPVVPPILDGRPPAAADEIALGKKTMERAGVRLGDAVAVRVSGFRSVRMRVVGQVVLPPEHIPDMGEGALITRAGIRTLLGRRDAKACGCMGSDVLVRLEPGADRAAVLRALRRYVGEAFSVVPDQKPTDIVNFGRVRNLPLTLAGILALLAAATLAHTLVSAVRRRRRDLAILKTVGFVRRQLLGAVLWQATTLASIAVLLGVPLGLALGRWAWAVLADEAGVVREPVLPGWETAVVVVGTILLANAVAALPGRAAARTQPVQALRAE